MRHRALLAVLASTALLALLGGCAGSSHQCDRTETPDADGGVIVPADCDMTTSPKDSPACVDDSVGVFVSAEGTDGAAGTKGQPLRSIAEGVARAASLRKPRVYVCTGTYEQNVTVEAPVSIFGGFGCGSWEPASAKPKLAPPSGVALTIKGISDEVVVEDVEIVGASDAATKGDSAIAAFVSQSTVVFRRAVLTATAGQEGAQGEASSNWSGQAVKGTFASGGTGGAPPTCGTCADGTLSRGGKGADSGGIAGGGSAEPAVGEANDGASGASSCTPGRSGANGNANATLGSGAIEVGDLTASGWQAAAPSGEAGNGRPAQGGGGGGSRSNTGSGGGAGGCGGCGGGGGKVGLPGGISVALLAFEAGVSLDASVLRSGAAGAGGAGGKGQDGQAGGEIGLGVCDGGPGGNGAGGNGGGGGAGGYSAAIMWKGGSEPVVSGGELNAGAPGAAGAGGQPGGGAGNPGVAGQPGSTGQAVKVLALP
jgi:hypothetical protein